MTTRHLTLATALAAGVVLGAALRVGFVHPTHLSLGGDVPTATGTSARPPCPPGVTRDTARSAPPAIIAPDSEAPDAASEALARRSARLWVTGVPEPWTPERDADPRWGREAVQQSLSTWQEMIPAPMELNCEEFPCMLILRLSESEAFKGHSIVDVEESEQRALKATDQWPEETIYSMFGWDYEFLGIAPIDRQDPNIDTRFQWRAMVEIARHGVPKAIEKVRATDPDIDLSGAP